MNASWIADKIERWPVEKLIPYARNARTHSDAQVAQIAASIREFGFTNPVLIDGGGNIIAGHGRVLAARKLGMQEVPCIRMEHLTDAQRRAYIIADNKLALNAGWDEEMLSIELDELAESGYELALTGFDEGEIGHLLDELGRQATTEDASANEEAAEDEIPDPPAVPVTRPGDLWLMGEHRLICADASDRESMQRLMAGELSHLVFTSPPYANQRDYITGGIKDWDAMMQGAFRAVQTALRNDAQILVNLGLVHRDNEWQSYWDGWIEWMRAQGWRRFGWYVWDQAVTMPGDWAGRLAPRHEFVFHFNRHSRKPNKIVPCKWAGHNMHLRADGTGMRGKDGEVGDWSHAWLPTQDFRIPDSVIAVTRQRGSIGDGIDHPAVFPVGLPQFFINAYTDAGEIVLEPFAGSGTTILAGELTGRRVRAVELAPAYVDVALRRWMQHHPDRVPVLEGHSLNFVEVAAERLGKTQDTVGSPSSARMRRELRSSHA
jgi:DNA modification methylase